VLSPFAVNLTSVPRRILRMDTLDLQDSIDLFLKSLSVNGLSKNTLRAYRSDMMGLLEKTLLSTSRMNGSLPSSSPDSSMNLTLSFGNKLTEESALTLEDTMASYLTSNRQTWSPNTLNRKLACFRRFGKWAGYPNFLGEYSKAPTPPGFAHPLPEGMDGVIKMVETARKPHHRALVVLTGMLGLRIHEALLIRPHHLNEESDPMELRFQGKGEKIREVPVHDRPYEYLLPRLLACWQTDERLVPLDDRAARRAITGIGQRALGHHVASHDMRMTFGTTAYYNTNGDIRATQELLGHASSETTVRYTHVDKDKRSKAANFWKEEE
jgi:site-specific recombinase XerC